MATAGMLKNPTMLIIVILLLGMILTPIGLLFFGVALIGGSILGLLIGLFIPAILVFIAFLAMFGVVPGVKPPWSFVVAMVLFVVAYALWAGWF